jgi:hypothetical protein
MANLAKLSGMAEGSVDQYWDERWVSVFADPEVGRCAVALWRSAGASPLECPTAYLFEAEDAIEKLRLTRKDERS